MGTREELKRLRELHHRKGRAEQGRFLVQGPKLVLEAAGSGWPIEAVHVCEAARDRWASLSPTVWPQHVMDRIGTLESGNEVVAVLHLPAQPPLQAPSPQELLLALDGIADPGNLGTVLRTADWFGIRRVLLAEGSADAFGPKCVQAGMGAVFRVAVHRGGLPAMLSAMREGGATLYLARTDGKDVFSEELRRPAVLVLGSEAHGISPQVLALGGTSIAVPRTGGAESLNVAMAAAALCMEFIRRQRG